MRISDWSSDVCSSDLIASEPLDVSRYGLVYAGAQKNLGPVGITVVIVRRDLLERAGQPPADIFNYASHAEAVSMLNPPPSHNWYLTGLVFELQLAEGGGGRFPRRSAEEAERKSVELGHRVSARL